MISCRRQLALALSLIGLLFAGGCSDDSGPNGELSDPAVFPRVAFTLPAGGSQGPYELFAPGPAHDGMPHVVVRFNKLIRKSSILATSVHIQGFDHPVTAILHPESDFRVDASKSPHRGPEAAVRQYDDLLAFDILDSGGYSGSSIYDVGQVVTVTLDTTIEDINGNHLARFTFSYMPEPAFRVTESIPENGTTNVRSIGNNLYHFFNTKCDPDIFSALSLTPGVTGGWNLAPDSATVYFLPTAPWPYNTRIALAIEASAHDRHGNMLGHSYATSFRTGPFQVSSAHPRGTDVSLVSEVSLTFSGPIDSASVRPAFAISPDVPGRIMAGYAHAGLFPTVGLAPSTLYTVTISTGLRASSGEPLPSDYSFQFMTDLFRVTSAYPTGVNVGTGTSIHVHFNAQLDGTTAAAAFTITPATEGTVGYVQGETDAGGYIDFFPSGSLAPMTTYTVTVGTSLKTRTGHNLLQPYSFSFTTEN